jgi:hypothetical protein
MTKVQIELPDATAKVGRDAGALGMFGHQTPPDSRERDILRDDRTTK